MTFHQSHPKVQTSIGWILKWTNFLWLYLLQFCRHAVHGGYEFKPGCSIHFYWCTHYHRLFLVVVMMTSSNGNIYSVTGPLYGNYRRIPPPPPPNKGQWHGALISLICVWTYGWVNNRDAGDSRRRAHYDVTAILSDSPHTFAHLRQLCFIGTRAVAWLFEQQWSSPGSFY